MKGYIDALRSQEPNQYTTMEFKAEASYSLAYVLQGDVGVNVRAALNANNGAIREFIINPGETWSFGRSIAPISAMGYLPKVYSPPTGQWVEGGGFCDVSSMYLNVALDLGLDADYPQHLGVSKPFPGIWLNEDGSGQDLKITNTKDRPVVFRAVEEGGELVVYGGFL
jgi:vancomycin resistance protein YoaR